MEDDDRIFDVLRDRDEGNGTRVGFAYRSAASVLTSIADVRGNVNYSPVSLWIALAMAAQGAHGRTLEQLTDTLSIDGLDAEQYRALVASFNRHQPNARSMTAVHGSVWVGDTLTPRRTFVDDMNRMFGADVNGIDFSDPVAGGIIGDWIGRHTKRLLRPTVECDGSESLAIVNTVYADGRWKQPFKIEDTTSGVFHGDHADAKVPFMHGLCKDVLYLCDEIYGWERLDIPFDDDGELRIVLPDPDNLETLLTDPVALRCAFATERTSAMPQEDRREPVGMDRLKAKLAARKNPASMPIYANTVTADVALPRFDIDSTIGAAPLVGILRASGITDAFDPAHADFSHLCDGPAAINGIMQGTHIEINEHGARAAAYTDVVVPGAAPQLGHRITFNVNRPFLYALMTRDKLPLFIGAVRNPRTDDTP